MYNSNCAANVYFFSNLKSKQILTKLKSTIKFCLFLPSKINSNPLISNKFEDDLMGKYYD